LVSFFGKSANSLYVELPIPISFGNPLDMALAHRLLPSQRRSPEIDMYRFLQRQKPTGDQIRLETRDAPEDTRQLVFDPRSIVRAIAFHLIDEGKCRAVDPHCIETVVMKLSHRLDHLAISAAHWAEMTNRERLRWLLNRSHVLVRRTSPESAWLSYDHCRLF
jgi:hypothetical protein